MPPSYRCVPPQTSSTYERSLEAHCDHLAQQCADLRAALMDLVDALFSLPGPSVWTETQHAHLRLTLRAALKVLDAIDTPASGALYV